MRKTRCDPTFAATLAVVACIAVPSAADAEVVRGVQYFHPEIEHYFMTVHQAEIAALDTGMIPGWYRTGTFYQFENTPKAGLAPVCRFMGVFGGKVTHFFTAWPDECAWVKTLPGWRFEGVAFYAALPDEEGACAAGTAPIHRLYDNGRGASPNHAYTPDVSKRDLLVANGWISEGVAFCSPASTGDALAKTQLLSNTSWQFPLSEPADCRDDAPGYFLFSPAAAGRGWMAWLGAPELDYVAFIGAAGDNDCRLGVSGADEGVAGWDAGANQYVLWYSNGYGVYTVSLFDRADLASMPVCNVTLTQNIDGRSGKAHPFQPVLWSACVSGTATRLKP
jgi:hypothetical protein